MSGSWRGGVRVSGLGVVRSADVGRRVCCCDGLSWERGKAPGAGSILGRIEGDGKEKWQLINQFNQIYHLMSPMKLETEDRK